jgi:diguanylate cyclase (GGDEF)-like protein
MRLRFLLGFGLVAAIAIGSIAVALAFHEREQNSFERNQRAAAARAANQAEAQAALSVGQLAGAAAFYQAEGNFSRHEFEIIADPLLDAGTLAATAFIDSVPRRERELFERRHGAEITDRGPLGELRTAAGRKRYYPLAYAAARGLTVTMPVGYDVATDASRGAYLLRARDRGRPAATRAMRLPVGGTGINVFRPVYRDGAPTATVAQRRAALIGFAAGGFRVPDLAGAAAAALPEEIDAALVDRGRTIAGPELPLADSATAPIRIADQTWLLVVRDPGRPDVSLPLMIALVGLSLAALLAALVLVWSRSERMQELTRQASRDPLTGLKNRRRFEEDLRTELARSHRYGSPGALLMLDLDHFKQVNDTLGHAAGDRVLAEIGRLLRDRARETDLVARLGGDEFAVVLPRCEPGEAQSVAEQIAAAIRDDFEAERAPLTASIGIAPFGVGRRLSYDSLLAGADAAMYAAKRSGGGAVRVSGSSSPPPDPPGAPPVAGATRQRSATR